MRAKARSVRPARWKASTTARRSSGERAGPVTPRALRLEGRGTRPCSPFAATARRQAHKVAVLTRCSTQKDCIVWPLAAYAASSARRSSGPYRRALAARDDAGRASPGKPGCARPASSIFFLFDIDISCPAGRWETAASVLDGYIKAEGVSLHPTPDSDVRDQPRARMESLNASNPRDPRETPRAGRAPFSIVVRWLPSRSNVQQGERRDPTHRPERAALVLPGASTAREGRRITRAVR